MDIETGRMQERISLELLQLNAATAESALSSGAAGLDPASVAAIATTASNERSPRISRHCNGLKDSTGTGFTRVTSLVDQKRALRQADQSSAAATSFNAQGTSA
jgi:hypothetical protein